MGDRQVARRPEDLTNLFVERANAGDADGIAELYEPNAVMAYPPGEVTVGRDAIRALWRQVLVGAPHFEPEPPLPTLVSGDIALTCTAAKDGAGAAPRWSAANPTAAGCACSTGPSSPSAASSERRCRRRTLSLPLLAPSPRHRRVSGATARCERPL